MKKYYLFNQSEARISALKIVHSLSWFD